MNITALLFIVGAAIASIWALLKGKEKQVNSRKIPDSVSRWESEAQKYAREFNVPLKYVLATIWQESAGKPGAVGSANEKGLMQLKQIAVKDAQQSYPDKNFDGWQTIPEQNIKAGVAFLAVQKRRAGDWFSALKAYNQGYQGMKVYPEKAQQYATGVENKAKFFA